MSKCVHLVCFTILVSALLIPVIQAIPPVEVSGSWTYTPTLVTTKEAGGNTFKSGEEDSDWSGSFDGTSHDTFEIIMHHGDFVTCQGRINFEGSVAGHGSGEMTILFVGIKSLETGQWAGKWVILSGTGDLANLHGEGTWEGVSMSLTYAGEIH